MTEEDQMNEQAWLWLSAVVESVDDQRTCLENVLYINPNNVNAKKGLEMLEAKAAKEKPVPPPPALAPEPVRPAAPPPTATSSASSTFVPEEPEPEVYDNWIGSLNLGGKGEEKPTATAPFTVPDGFDDDSFADDNFDDFSFDDEDNVPASSAKPTWQGNDLRSALMDDDEDDDMNFDDPFDSDPFADDPFADEDSPNLRSGPFSAAALDDDDDDDEVVDASALRGIQSPPAPIPMPRRTSPTPPSPAPAKPQSFANTNASRYFVADDVKPLDEPDPSEYFAAIPQEIKATRLPGTDERHPRLVMMGLVLLVLLNIGAVGLLVFQLVG